MELVVWANNRATCGATRCASRCSGWQGRSAAGVTLPVVKGVRGSPSADAVREGSAGADPKSDRSIVPRNAREKKLRSRVVGIAICTLVGNRGGNGEV